MKKLVTFAAASFVSIALFACSEPEPVDVDPDVDEETAREAVATSQDPVTGRVCYCTGKARCGHSKSPSYMHANARAALKKAGVPTSALSQTYGDAPASVGTHCPEPGKTYSAAVDMAQGANPCARTRALRKQGFAAWYRRAPEFPGNLHIHAVYAGAPGIKASLSKQIDSFLQGRNGLARNGIDNHCPITEAEKEAVRKVRAGSMPKPADAGTDASPTADAGPDDASAPEESLPEVTEEPVEETLPTAEDQSTGPEEEPKPLASTEDDASCSTAPGGKARIFGAIFGACAALALASRRRRRR